MRSFSIGYVCTYLFKTNKFCLYR